MRESEGDMERQQVRAVVDREVAAAQRGDIRAYVRLLDDGAVFLPPNQPPKDGADLRQWLRDFLKDFTVEWLSFTHHKTEVSGDLAYHTYSYGWKITSKAGGEPLVEHGKGLHVLRRDSGGTWRILREIWNSSPAPSN